MSNGFLVLQQGIGIYFRVTKWTRPQVSVLAVKVLLSLMYTGGGFRKALGCSFWWHDFGVSPKMTGTIWGCFTVYHPFLMILGILYWLYHIPMCPLVRFRFGLLQRKTQPTCYKWQTPCCVDPLTSLICYYCFILLLLLLYYQYITVLCYYYILLLLLFYINVVVIMLLVSLCLVIIVTFITTIIYLCIYIYNINPKVYPTVAC